MGSVFVNFMNVCKIATKLFQLIRVIMFSNFGSNQDKYAAGIIMSVFKRSTL